MLVRLFILLMAFTTVRGVWLRFFPEVEQPQVTQRYENGTYTCRNAQGMEFVTSDEAACRTFETSYSCEVEEGSYYPVANAIACKAKQEEVHAQKLKEFDVNKFADDYKDALDVAAERTKGRGY